MNNLTTNRNLQVHLTKEKHLFISVAGIDGIEYDKNVSFYLNLLEIIQDNQEVSSYSKLLMKKGFDIDLDDLYDLLQQWLDLNILKKENDCSQKLIDLGFEKYDRQIKNFGTLPNLTEQDGIAFQQKISTSTIGVLESEIYVVGSKKLSNHNLLILSVVVMGLSVIFIGVFESRVFSLFFFSLFELCTGIFTSSVHVVQNRALLKQEHKSKTLSIIDFSTEIVIIICLQFINFGMKLISIKLMFIVSGCLLFPIATLVGLCLRGRKEKNGIL